MRNVLKTARRPITLLLILTMLIPLFQSIKVFAAYDTVYYESFENGISGWSMPYGGTKSHTNETASMGDYSLKMTNRTKSWQSPAKNIYSVIRENGAGKYAISMRVMVTSLNPDAKKIGMLIRTSKENSFSTNHSGNYFYRLTGKYSGVTENTWLTLSGTVDILDSDISPESGKFNLMIDILEPVDGQTVYIDEVRIQKYTAPEDLVIDRTSGYLYIGETMKINANKEHGVGFYSSNMNVAKVNSKGEVTAVSAGQTTIHVTFGTQKRYCTVTVDPKYHNLEDGTYYFRNVEHGLYMQVDNNDSGNNYSGDKVIMELWNYSGDDHQKWNIQYTGNGYYKILNVKSGKALSVQQSKENTDNKALVQENYSGLDRQLWQISMLADGYFKLKPKSSESYDNDWCAAAGDGIGDPNGRNVEQREFVNDTSYIDEWRLFFMNGDDFIGIAIENDNVDRHTIFKNIFYSMSFTSINEFDFVNMTSMPKDEYIAKLDTAKIFVSRSHGGSSESKTWALLGSDRIYSTDLYAYDLSNLDLALFIGCNMACNRDTGKNLIDACVEQGAKCAIGFSTTVDTYYANLWTENFFEYYSAGENIDDACRHAHLDILENYNACKNYSYQIAKKGA